MTLTCQHHYLLAAPSGPISRGICQKCGAVREFPSSLGGQGEKLKTPLDPPLDFEAAMAVKRARAKKAQGARKRTEKVCAICGLPYLAYRPNQQTCRMVKCRRAWNRMGGARRRESG